MPPRPAVIDFLSRESAVARIAQLDEHIAQGMTAWNQSAAMHNASPADARRVTPISPSNHTHEVLQAIHEFEGVRSRILGDIEYGKQVAGSLPTIPTGGYREAPEINLVRDRLGELGRQLDAVESRLTFLQDASEPWGPNATLRTFEYSAPGPEEPLLSRESGSGGGSSRTFISSSNNDLASVLGDHGSLRSTLATAVDIAGAGLAIYGQVREAFAGAEDVMSIFSRGSLMDDAQHRADATAAEAMVARTAAAQLGPSAYASSFAAIPRIAGTQSGEALLRFGIAATEEALVEHRVVDNLRQVAGELSTEADRLFEVARLLDELAGPLGSLNPLSDADMARLIGEAQSYVQLASTLQTAADGYEAAAHSVQVGADALNDIGSTAIGRAHDLLEPGHASDDKDLDGITGDTDKLPLAPLTDERTGNPAFYPTFQLTPKDPGTSFDGATDKMPLMPVPPTRASAEPSEHGPTSAHQEGRQGEADDHHHAHQHGSHAQKSPDDTKGTQLDPGSTVAKVSAYNAPPPIVLNDEGDDGGRSADPFPDNVFPSAISVHFRVDTEPFPTTASDNSSGVNTLAPATSLNPDDVQLPLASPQKATNAPLEVDLFPATNAFTLAPDVLPADQTALSQSLPASSDSDAGDFLQPNTPTAVSLTPDIQQVAQQQTTQSESGPAEPVQQPLPQPVHVESTPVDELMKHGHEFDGE